MGVWVRVSKLSSYLLTVTYTVGPTVEVNGVVFIIISQIIASSIKSNS